MEKILFRFVKQAVSIARKLTDAALMQISHPAGNGVAGWKHAVLHFLRKHMDATLSSPMPRTYLNHYTLRRVAVDETAIQVGMEWPWCYAAIDLDSLVVLDVELFSRRGTDPASAFLARLMEYHDLSEAELLVDNFGYRTALSRLGLSGQGEYSGRNHIERWFQTLKRRTDRFYTTWNSGPTSPRRWLQRFVHYYNHGRPNQALNGRIPAKKA